MNLVASLICRNEMDRLLPLAVESLLEFCDEIRVLDDGSTDGTYEWLLGQDRVSVLTNTGPTFFEHEGRARNELLKWTFEANPTHVLAIDADEFVSDGQELRRSLTRQGMVWTLQMEEVWKADGHLWIRSDGGWRPHPVPILYALPSQRPASRNKRLQWQVLDRQLSCGREPLAVRHLAGRAIPTHVSILHFGWLDTSKRQERYDRYVTHDGGNFHNLRHLNSIMWEDRQIKLFSKPWPADLTPLRDALSAQDTRVSG